ncbi:uncharacterized protein LOC112638710 [Camponotus floridanus]|uniref:uncharacterized protein LOC112638710 n=1 Tax=Camponotus floridanus TaxID=104421 RepID=UPI000DC6B39D|nr:uncharacterized protein LOC112638710 [Camponotus floridanus]
MFARPIMFAGLGQKYRRVFGASVTPATLSAPPMTGPFVAPPNRRDDYAASAKDEDATRDRSDTPPVIKKARLYTEDKWNRNWLFKREINFARHPIRILGRRYPLTKTAYKYIDIAVAVKRKSQVDIVLGDCHEKEISLTPDMWKDLLALRNDILPYFENDLDEAVARPPTSIIVGTVTLRFGKINNLKTLRFEMPKNRIALSHSTVKALFVLELCVNHIIASLTGILETVDAKLSRFLDIATKTDHPGDIPEAIRRHEHFNANDLIDCELHALLFGLYHNL